MYVGPSVVQVWPEVSCHFSYLGSGKGGAGQQYVFQVFIWIITGSIVCPVFVASHAVPVLSDVVHVVDHFEEELPNGYVQVVVSYYASCHVQSCGGINECATSLSAKAPIFEFYEHQHANLIEYPSHRRTLPQPSVSPSDVHHKRDIMVVG